ncbi:alpha/beta hydrolase [Streptomyces sp. NBC_01803]|uniref:alpha/beta hydrolase n=1 Tax=Streptomyces sp. NBC_01803 TaxID=2975946 RepID=UPI002DD964BA|nr:alpha/beta hydrolase [Streptomyces sp. NBC_01803]WSA44235.1 alpha/beta hydrolase [Streptomyces sp. NBC_01803]
MTTRPAVRVAEDLPYATAPDGTRLALDLYVPPRAHHTDPAPAVLYLHGGGWLTGSRTDHRDRLTGLAEHGVAVASADYRFAHRAPFPAQLDDARAAVRWLRRQGAAHGLDPGRIGVWGASAGAHLAAHLALAPEPPATAVRAMVGYFGTYDLTPAAAHLRPDPGLPLPDELRDAVWPAGLPSPPSARLRQALLAGVPEPRLGYDDLAALSPITRVHPDAPPMLLLHGTGDAVTGAGQSLRLAEAVRAAGGDARTVLIDGANHEDPVFDTHATLAVVAEFLTDRL